MEYCDLAPGLQVSRIITGLWQVADMERSGPLDPDIAAEGLRPYIRAGMTTFDMADHYGSAEIIAGRLKGEGAQLLTKWAPQPGKTPGNAARQAVQRAMRRLNTEKIDLLQYHAWNYADPVWLDHLFQLKELRAEGLVAHLGLTNVDTAHLRMLLATGIPIVSNQICYSLLDQRARGPMTALCEESGVKILAFGVLAGGFLTEKWLHQPEPTPDQLTTWSQMKYKRFIDITGGWAPFQELLRTLAGIAKKYGVSLANIATGYILRQPAVGGVIIGARPGASEHIEDNRKLISLDLDPESLLAINAALTGLAPIPGDCGDEYRKPPYLTAAGDLSHHFTNMPPPFPVKPGENGVLQAFSGTVWEEIAGFCRAIRKGDQIRVSGTTATHGHRLIGGGDPAAQACFVLDKIEGALQSLGGRLEDVARTRVFIQRLEDWEAVARVHGARFKGIQPANTMVRADLIGEGYLVEMEADAVLSGRMGLD